MSYFIFSSRPDFELLASFGKKFSFIGYRHSNQALHMLKVFDRKFKMVKHHSFPTAYLNCENEGSDELAANIEDLSATLHSPSIEAFSVQVRTCAALSEMTGQATYFAESHDYVDSACFAKGGKIISLGITPRYDAEAHSRIAMLSMKSGKTRCAVLDFEGDSGTVELLANEQPWCNPQKATKADQKKAHTESFWPDSLWPKDFGKIADLAPISEIVAYDSEIVRHDASGRKPKTSYKRNGRP